MTGLDCPFCGPRPLEEFAFRRTWCADAPDPIGRIYERDGRADRSLEHWQHVGGCRAWLTVSRNPSTDETVSISFLGVSGS